MDGAIFSDMKEGSYDGPAFVNFIENLLPHVEPWPARRSILVMDNCAIHHVDDVAPLCAAQ